VGDRKGNVACRNGGLSGLVTTALDQVRGNAVVLRNSAFTALGSASSAVLGFVYWWFAARTYPPATVGIQSALISTMTFVGLLGEAGFGTMLVGEALGQRDRAAAMIGAAVLAGSGAALMLAVPASGLLVHYGWVTLPAAVFFALGCALTGCSFVVDGAFIGLLHGSWQLYRNVLFSVLKLGLLIGAAAMTQNGTWIMLTWVIGLGVTLAFIWWRASMTRLLALTWPDFRSLSGRMSVVIDHHALNLAAAAPTLTLPLVVSACAGPDVNAAFYSGWMVLFIGTLVPASLTTVLFTVGAVDRYRQAQRFRFSFALSLAFSVPVALVLALFSDRILGLFNPAYPALAGSAVRLFGLGLLGGVVKQHFILLMRMQRRMMHGALWLGAGACLELSLAAAGGATGAVDRLTIGWLIAVTVEVAFLLYPVLRVLRSVPPMSAIA
jgi:O-antigen/teichoic acid export membrane protein